MYLVIDQLKSGQAYAIEKHIKSMKSNKYIENLKALPEMVEKLKNRYSQGSGHPESIGWDTEQSNATAVLFLFSQNEPLKQQIWRISTRSFTMGKAGFTFQNKPFELCKRAFTEN